MLTKLPVKNPKKPIMNKKMFLANRSFPISSQFVIESMIGGAINANVDELTAPTNEINKSNLGMAAARATEIGRKKWLFLKRTYFKNFPRDHNFAT